MTRKIGSVHQLWRYPVSSFAGERIDRAGFAEAGMQGDRRGAFHEVDTGKVVFPGIVRKWNIAPRISARTAASGGIEISLDGTRWSAIGDPDLDRDFAAFCGTPVVFKPYGTAQGDEPVKQRYDFSPVHLVSRQALEALRARLPDSTIDVRRFRPNIVADLPGLDGRCPENRLIGTEFTIGGVRLRGTRASGRCSFTTLAQRDLPEDHDVLRALIHEFGKDFGIYCEVLEPGDLTRSDPIMLAEAERPIVIVGAGQAGAHVARNLRELGCRQPIRILGDEEHAPYERPPLSKSDATDGPSPVLPPDTYRDLDLDLSLSSRVEQIDRARRDVVTADGTAHPYDRLVLAPGGAARALPSAGAPHPRVHALRTLDDAARLHPLLKPGARLAVIGSGWLGLELAAVGQRQGCKVTLYARRHRVLARSLPADVADFIEARHRSEGVAFRMGSAPALQIDGDQVRVMVGRHVDEVDVVVVAIGIVPNEALAEQAGLRVDDGIVVDATGRTSDPAIFAAGDVARVRTDDTHPGRRVESWHNANDQARALARRLMFLPPEPTPVPRFWSTQYDMTIQIAGHPDPEARPLSADGGIAPFWDFGSFAVGINRPRDIRAATARLNGDVEPAATTEVAPAAQRRREAPTRRARIGQRSDFADGALVRVEVPGLGAILVLRQEGRIHAVDDMCPHAAASLAEGFVENGRIVCPVHFAEFDPDTGQPYNAPPGCERLQCYDVDESGEDVFVCF